jgi:hypothetical protein
MPKTRLYSTAINGKSTTARSFTSPEKEWIRLRPIFILLKEEPAAFVKRFGREYLDFGSSANLSPPWNPMQHNATFGLDVWLIATDQVEAARCLTHFNTESKERHIAYPAAYDADRDALYVTVVPGGRPGGNPPGAIYWLDLRNFF